MKKLKTTLQCNNLYKIIAIIVLIYSLIVTLIPKYQSKYKGNENEFICKILEYVIDGNKLEINGYCKENILINYYFNSEDEKKDYEKNLIIGSSIKIKGSLSEPLNNTVPYLFNYKKYLYNKKIYYLLNAEEINVVNKDVSFLYKIKNLAYNKVKNTIHNEYLYAYILGSTDKLNTSVIESYRTNGISHLFALSGLHVGIFSMILLKILKKFKLKEKHSYIIIFLFLLLFSFITGFSPSILRASLLFILIGLNKVYKLEIKTINILYLTFSILLVINPFLIHNLSFILSFLTTFFIILTNDFINDKNYIKGLLKVSAISFISTIGVSSYYFGYINPIGILYNLIFVPFVTFIIFPLTLIIFIFPFLSNILYFLTSIMEALSLWLTNFKLTIYFPYINILETIVFYLILISFIKTKKKRFILLIIIILMIWKIKPILNSNTEIYFIDVGQGDSALIVTPHRSSSILIDTGGTISYNTESWKIRNNEYSIAKDKLIPLMRKLGINHLDYMILTHGDFDHMGEATNLIENFKVDKIIFNKGEYNTLELNLIEILKEKNIEYYQNIKELNIDNNKLYFLNSKLYDNENDNSNVVYTELNGIKVLLMGDAGVDVEKDIITKYNLDKIDILKVGHHGSKTSSGKEFIDSINPKYSVISVGKNNRYGHPKDEVLKTLENSITYRTDQEGSVVFTIKNNKISIETYAP